MKKYNIVNENLLSLEEYQKSRDKFMNLLSHKSGSKFKIFRNYSISTLDVDVKLKKVTNFLSELSLNGTGIKLNWIG